MNITQTTESPFDRKYNEPVSGKSEITEPFAELCRGVHTALETYSNVHRGSGYNSIVSTYLFEQAREIVLKYLGLDKEKFVVIFCSPRSAEVLKAQLKPESYKIVSSQDIAIPLGVRAIAAGRKALPGGAPFHTGGGTTRLVSPDWVIWADAPDKFEAGTPAIINVIAFARALQLIRHFGNSAFQDAFHDKLTAYDILFHDELEEYSGRKLLEELRKTLIGRDILVPTTEGEKPFINLDNGASTPTFTPVWNAVYRTWQQSKEVHHEIIDEVRSICSGFLSAPRSEYDIFFTSNTTEAINLAAESLNRESGQENGYVVINTLLEHTSNDLPWRMYPNISLIRMNIDEEGFVDLNALDSLLSEYNEKGLHGKKRISLMAVSGASNVLGVFNNLEEISRIVHKYGARLLVDAAQLIAHRKVEIEKCRIDYLAFSAHKAYAPFGTGVLVVRKDLLKFSPEEKELIRASGEENVGGIAALGKVLLILKRIGMDLIREEEQALTRYALRGLSQINGLTIYGIKNPDSQNFAHKGGVIVFTLKKIFSNVTAKKLAETGGIGIRYGCHCSHILIKHLVGVGPFLARFQWIIAKLFHKINFPGLARISFGIENNEKDVDTLIHELNKIVLETRKSPKSDIKQQMNDFVTSAVQRVYLESVRSQDAISSP
jgi:selenocysteine lyase/cysteine desulfurase